MAIEHADSFDIYGTDETLMTDGVYAEVGNTFGGHLVADPDGVSTQRVVRCYDGIAFRYALETPTDVVGMSMRIWMDALPTSSQKECIPFEWRDIDNNRLGYVAVQTNGAVKLVVDDIEIVSTDSPVLTAEAWWHLEGKVDVATGTFELRIEGEDPAIDETGLSFPSAVVYQVAPRSEGDITSASTHMYIKDFVVWNDLGSENNDFLGLVRVINLIPEEDVTIGGWSPSTGTEGWPILDNNPPVNTVFMSAEEADVDDFMQYEMTDLPDDITAVRGVITFVRARKVDGGYGQLQSTMVGTGDAESDGADRAITAGFVYWRDVHEQDPGTAAAWTRVGVNNSTLKINRTL